MEIILSGINKSFNDQTVLKNINITASRGEVFGFLGPNGAGKTTTIKIILGLIYPDSGRIFFDGNEFTSGDYKILSRFGTIIEEPSLIPELNGMDNLKYFSILRSGKINRDDLLELALKLGINTEALKKKVIKYSLGMKQRLAICVSLLHNPDALIYDEPTNGLDPEGIAFVRNLLREKAHKEGKTVFISSHNLAEVEKTCDRVAIINKGEIIAQGTVKEVITNNNFKNLEEAFLELTRV